MAITAKLSDQAMEILQVAGQPIHTMEKNGVTVTNIFMHGIQLRSRHIFSKSFVDDFSCLS